MVSFIRMAGGYEERPREGDPVIYNREEYDVVLNQLRRLEAALESLRRDVEPLNKRNFEVMAEGYAEEIEAFRSELNEFLAREANPPMNANGAVQNAPICEASGQT